MQKNSFIFENEHDWKKSQNSFSEKVKELWESELKKPNRTVKVPDPALKTKLSEALHF